MVLWLCITLTQDTRQQSVNDVIFCGWRDGAYVQYLYTYIYTPTYFCQVPGTRYETSISITEAADVKSTNSSPGTRWGGYIPTTHDTRRQPVVVICCVLGGRKVLTYVRP